MNNNTKYFLCFFLNFRIDINKKIKRIILGNFVWNIIHKYCKSLIKQIKQIFKNFKISENGNIR